MMMVKYRVHEVAKDFGLPTKKVVDILAKHFEEPKKSMTALNEEELDIVFDTVTQQNQVENFDAYFATREQAKQAQAQQKTAPETAGESAEKAAGASEEKAGDNPDGTAKAVPKKEKKPGAPPKRGPAQVHRVDTRTAHVELDRYNEKYEQIAPARTL